MERTTHQCIVNIAGETLMQHSDRNVKGVVKHPPGVSDAVVHDRRGALSVSRLREHRTTRQHYVKAHRHYTIKLNFQSISDFLHIKHDTF